MFCPKCGTENPETGKFCRSCGTDLGNVSDALSGRLPAQKAIVNHKGKPVHWEGALTKLFMGLAFVVVAIALALTGRGSGWWFWMLIPGFMFVGSGIAQYIQLKRSESGDVRFASSERSALHAPPQNAPLPPSRTEYVAPAETRYKTGELVPPSVTEGTTRHLEMDSEGETMTLPKV
jgi:hypothetical protein